MVKNSIYLFLFFLLTGSIIDIASNGAPASSTGAPGEVSCTTSGCHDDNALNSGGGTTSLFIENGLTEYVPGETYNISVSINQGILNRFGFQLTALKDTDSSNAGTLLLTEAGRTQIISGYGNLLSRKYITYTYPGTNAVTPGTGQWSFNWTAPEFDEGPVTLYLATIAANDDGTDAADYCYLKSLQLTAVPTGIQPNAAKQRFEIFPNPVSDLLNIQYTLQGETTVKFELYDIKGSRIQDWGL